MNLFLWLRCGLIAIMAFGFLPLPAAGVVLDKDFSHIAMIGRVWVSPLSVEIPTAQEALDRYKMGEFIAPKGNLARGYRKESTWLVFELESHDPHNERIMMTVAPAYTDRITAYQTAADGTLVALGAAGDQVPQSEKSIPSLVPAFAIDLRNAKITTVLLRIQTINTMAAIVNLYRWERYPSVATNEAMVAGAILCACGLMLLLAVGMYLAYRDRLYLLWFAYLAVTSVVWASGNGQFAYFYTSRNTQAVNDISGFSSVLSLCISSLLTIYVFRFRSISVWLDRLYLGWAGFLALIAPICFAFGWLAILSRVLMLSGLPMMAISGVCITLQMHRRVREALLHGPFFLIFLGFTYYYMAALLGLAEFTESTSISWQVAGLFNVFSLQVAMLLHARRSQREGAAERERLNQALSTQNEQLESTVVQRTQSLNAALSSAHQREAEQRQFIAMLSHEVRSPIAVIGSAAQLLSMHLRDLPQHQPLLQKVQRGAARLSNFFDNCLTQDRVFSNNYTLKPVDVDLVELLRMARESGEALADAHQLDMELPVAPVHVSCDAVLLRIAVMNLLANAFKFSPAGSSVILRLLDHGATCRIEVQDQGPGVPEKDRELIFQKYRRGGAAERKPGAGLGLAIVQEVVGLHHGSVFVQTATGGGALFVIELPCARFDTERTQ